MSRWGGRDATRARAQLAPLVESGAAVCPRCGRPVLPDQAWHADHWPVAHADGGREVVPSHAHCNTSAGGQMGAARTNARRPRVVARMDSERARGIRGVG